MIYHVIVVRPEDGRVLALPSSDGWSIPAFTPVIADARVVEHINAEMQRRLGLDIWTLRCAARGATDGEAWRIFVAVAREPSGSIPKGARWIGRPQATSADHFAHQIVGKAVEAWFAELESPSPFRAPWETIGWHAAACGWVSAQLDELGFIAVASIAQQRAWGLSCTMKIATDRGAVFFKATPPFMAHEGRATQAIAEHCPSLLPVPLAVEPERGWLLMSDYGSDMLHECADISRWEEALRLYSEVQVAQVERVRWWLSLDLPDRRLGRMVEMIDPLIASCRQMLSGGPSGLSEEEADDLRSLSMPLKLMCAQLAQSEVPHTLVHGDLGGNVLMREGGYTFFDWTDVSVSHPFFDMATISGAYFDESVLIDSPDTDARLRDAYLTPWTKYATMERLVEVFEASRPLGVLHQAMTYMWILTNIAPGARPELEGGLLHWLRNLLRLCGRAE